MLAPVLTPTATAMQEVSAANAAELLQRQMQNVSRRKGREEV